MLSISSLIDFLLNLLRDDAAQAEFARDPQGVLARHGLEGVTAQDVCDAAPMVADTHGVSPRHHDDDDDDGGSSRHGGDHHRSGHDKPDHHHKPEHHQSEHHHRPEHDDDDAVREIHTVTKHYQVDREVVVQHHTSKPVYNEYNHEHNYYDHSVTTGDDSTVVQDSFNQDNDGVDNKGGIINDSNVAGDDQDDVGNTDVDVEIDESFNEDSSENTEVEDSFNDESDNSTEIDDSGNDSSIDAEVEVEDSFNTDNTDNSVDVEGDLLDSLADQDAA